jgi:hypothetical protein
MRHTIIAWSIRLTRADCAGSKHKMALPPRRREHNKAIARKRKALFWKANIRNLFVSGETVLGCHLLFIPTDISYLRGLLLQIGSHPTTTTTTPNTTRHFIHNYGDLLWHVDYIPFTRRLVNHRERALIAFQVSFATGWQPMSSHDSTFLPDLYTPNP